MDTIDNIQGIDYEYEEVLCFYDDFKYGEKIVCVLGSKGRIDYTFTWERLNGMRE